MLRALCSVVVLWCAIMAGNASEDVTPFNAALGSGRKAITTTYAPVFADRGYILDYTGAAGQSINLPATATIGAGYIVGIYDSGASTVTVAANGGDQIAFAGSTGGSKVLSTQSGMVITSNGAGLWETIGFHSFSPTFSALTVNNGANLGTLGLSSGGNVIAGVTTASAVQQYQVGEVVTATGSAVAVGATSTTGNVASIALTPGDWLISGSVTITGGATGLTGSSVEDVSVVTTTATNGTAGVTMSQQTIPSTIAGGLSSLNAPMIRVQITSNTTYYLTEQVTYAAGSPTASGTITATRMR